MSSSDASLTTIEATTDDVYDFDEVSILSLFVMIEQTDEEVLFANHGYKKLDKITDTLQGELYKALSVETGSSVVIKKVCKKMTKDQTTERDGFTYLVDENIISEASILRQLTNYHSSFICDHLVQFVDFFESDSYHYLVLEYIDGINLKEFIQTAQSYIKCGKLSSKHYLKAMERIMWQLTITINHLHTIAHCCHLDLCAENVMLENSEFIVTKNGSISISDAISIKLCDFGVSETFESADSSKSIDFQCYKHNLNIDNLAYVAPKVFECEYYDARAADMWSLGMLFYQCLTGQSLYSPSDMGLEKKNGYLAVYDGQKSLRRYLETMNYSKNFSQSALDLLVNLLHLNETKRISTSKCIEHRYFAKYGINNLQTMDCIPCHHNMERTK